MSKLSYSLELTVVNFDQKRCRVLISTGIMWVCLSESGDVMVQRAVMLTLCLQEFHLEYDKLEERPHVPTAFNYNPAQQAF